jgi:putative redox protein
VSNTKEAIVTWDGDGMAFTAAVTSGSTFPLSSGAEAPSPMEYLLAGVAGCTAIDVVGILQKMRQPLTGLRVELVGTRADDHPKVYTHATLTYVAHGAVDPEALQKAVQLSKEKYCSASIMFQRAGVTFELSSRVEPPQS